MKPSHSISCHPTLFIPRHCLFWVSLYEGILFSLVQIPETVQFDEIEREEGFIRSSKANTTLLICQLSTIDQPVWCIQRETHGTKKFQSVELTNDALDASHVHSSNQVTFSFDLKPVLVLSCNNLCLKNPWHKIFIKWHQPNITRKIAFYHLGAMSVARPRT